MESTSENGECEDQARARSQNDPAVVLIAALSTLLLFWTLGVFFFPLGDAAGDLSDLVFLVLPKGVGVLTLAGTFAALAQVKALSRPNVVFAISCASLVLPVCLVVDAHIAGDATFLRIAGFAVFGVGQACLVSQWSACVARVLDNRQVGLCSVVSAALAVLLCAGTLFFYRTSLLGCIALALVVSLALLRYFSSWSKAKSAEGLTESSVKCDRPTPKLFAFIGIQGVIYGTFFVAFLCLPLGLQPLALTGALVGVLLAYFGEVSQWRISLSPNMGQRILSLIIVMALVACTLGVFLGGEEAGMMACLCLLAVSGTFFLITSYVLLVVQSKEFGYSAVVHFSAGRVPVWSGMVLGMLASVVALQIFPFAECFVVLANVLLVVQAASGAVHRPVDPVMGQAVDVAAHQESEAAASPSNAAPYGLFKTCALQVAHESDLTPREEEIFLLLLKGRNSRYLQETLFITESTVKTHMSNIYRKVGVKSKQELINRVESCVKQMVEAETAPKDKEGLGFPAKRKKFA